VKQKILGTVAALLITACASVFTFLFSANAQGRDISQIVPPQVSYATPLVQQLSDGGLQIQKVALSKYNGGYFGPTKAVWVKTDKGILEAVFFDKPADLNRIQLQEDQTGNAENHKYTVTLSDGRTVTWNMGHASVYFIKYKDALIITRDGELNEALNFMLK
jgi:hypothetical protein